MKNKIVREVIDFIKQHQLLFNQVIQEDVSEADELTMEQINLVVGILSKVRMPFSISSGLICFGMWKKLVYGLKSGLPYLWIKYYGITSIKA